MRIKRKRFVFNRMRLFYFKEKPTTLLRHESKNMTNIQDDERLAEELQKYPCLYEKGNKRYKERDWQENAWNSLAVFTVESSLLSLKISLYRLPEM